MLVFVLGQWWEVQLDKWKEPEKELQLAPLWGGLLGMWKERQLALLWEIWKEPVKALRLLLIYVSRGGRHVGGR